MFIAVELLYNRRMKATETKSYKKLIQAHVMSLEVCKEEQMAYYREVHRLMAMGGIIHPQSIMEERKKPFNNSPWGEFKNYDYREGKRVHVASYILNKQGAAKVNEILSKYVTDRFLTKGKLASADPFVKELRGQVDGSLLKSWLTYNGVSVREDKKDGLPHTMVFTLDNRKHTYYYKENLVVWSKEDKPLPPFWFIRNRMAHPVLSTKQEQAVAAMQIFTDYWNVKFGNGISHETTKEAEG